MLSIRNGCVVTDKLGLVMDGKGGGRKRGEMEKSELEERQSYTGQEDEIDPDALSYIDEKIQHVLGHFQKEFQGGVSAEALRAQFGGYGSFLPSFQHSPSISSQPKNPMEMPNHTEPSSLYSSETKGGHHNPSVAGTTSIAKASTAATGKVSEMSDKRKASIGTHTAEGISCSLSKSVNIGDQKMLKLRINVGRDNGLARNKPDIYSDLGLDISPSPSLEDTSDGSEECSPKSPDAFLESPTTILQVMTCFSVPGGYLSPLPDSLLHSNGKEGIILTKFKTGILHNGHTEAWAASPNTSLNIKLSRSSTCNESRSSEKNQMLREVDELPDMCDVVQILNKETEAETPVVAQSIITTALDMSHTSHSMLEDTREKRQKISDSEKEIFEGPDNASLEGGVPDSFVSNDTLVNINSNSKLNFKSTSTIKPLEERIENNQGTSYAKAEMGCKALNNYDTIKVESNGYGGRKNHTTEAYEGGSLWKGSPSNDRSVAEPSNDNLSTTFSATSKVKNEMPKTPKLHKGDNNNSVIESHNGLGVGAHCQEVDDNKHTFCSSRFIKKSKEKLQLQISNSVTDASVVAPLTTNSKTSGAPAMISDPDIGEIWALCDLCKEWRLLPYGTNPDSLPKEWQCSMQSWLPGLNKCYISEDEAAKAFRELYQVPASLNVTNMTVLPDIAMPSITSSDILNHNGRLENNVHSAPLVGKKKHSLMNSSNVPNGSSLSYLSNSGKNVQPSSGNTILKNEKDTLNLQRVGQLSRSVNHTMEKHNHKVEELSNIIASCQNEGAFLKNCGKQSMSKSKRKVDLDDHSSSKKNKKDSLHQNEKDFHTEDPRAARKILQCSGNQNHSSSKSFRTIPAPVKMLKENVGVFFGSEHKKHASASDAENPDKSDSKDRKRELKELQVCGTHRKHSMISQQIANMPMVKDGSSESEHRRQKKAKVVKSKGHDFIAVINGKVDEKGCWTRTKLSSSKNYQPPKGHALECMDAIKQDVTNVQPVAAATSGSSNVSGSQKIKNKLEAAGGSPVESVSSSPMRILNTQNSCRYLLEKDDILNISPPKESPKNSSDVDINDSSDQSQTMTKEPAYKSRHRVSKASKTAEPGVFDSLYASNDYQGRKTFSAGKTGCGLHLKRDTHDDILPNDFCQANVVYHDENVTNQLNKYPLEQSNKKHICDENEHHDCGHQRLRSTHCRDSKKDSTFGTKKCKPKVLDSYSDLKELDHLHPNKEHNLGNHFEQRNVLDSREIVAGASHTKFISQEHLHQVSSHQRQVHSSQIVGDISERGPEKVNQTCLTVKDKKGKYGWCSQKAPTVKEINSEQYHVDAVNGGASKSAQQLRKSHALNGTCPDVLSLPRICAAQCSPVKKDVLTTVNAFIQEARELKHTADHLKNGGSEQKSSRIFFEASLKFLHVASLMELSNTETERQGGWFPTLQILHMYLETARLCEFSAREYENLREMAAAALAYKCAEVAYMKVAYFKHPSARKDSRDLEAALDATLPDNQGGFEKASASTATGSSQIAGDLVISARNRSHLKRLLTYTNYLNCAFEAANKSRDAVAVASAVPSKYADQSLCSVRKVLDFNFNNVKSLLQLVRTTLNSISCKV